MCDRMKKKTFFGNTDVQQIQEDRILQIMPIYYKKMLVCIRHQQFLEMLIS